MFKRRRIEDAILAQAARIDTARADARWLDDETFWDFIYAWHDLGRYYELCGDTTLGADVLRLYMQYAALLRRIIDDDRVHLRRRERAESALMELTYQVDAVIRQVERNLRQNGG